MTTSTVLRGLEQRGLVGRILDTQDARIRRVLLTIAGNTLVTQAVDVAEQADKDFCGRVSKTTCSSCSKH